MQKVFGYLLTWTTYGSWLKGDRRKYVKNGKILEPNPLLESKNKGKRSRENRIFVIASEAKQSKTVCF